MTTPIVHNNICMFLDEQIIDEIILEIYQKVSDGNLLLLVEYIFCEKFHRQPRHHKIKRFLFDYRIMPAHTSSFK